MLCQLERTLQPWEASACCSLASRFAGVDAVYPGLCSDSLCVAQSDSLLSLTDLSDHPADVSGGYLVEFEHGQNTDGVQNINLTR